jgi:hypothetical protein
MQEIASERLIQERKVRLYFKQGLEKRPSSCNIIILLSAFTRKIRKKKMELKTFLTGNVESLDH